jgi:hypothetical protein
LGKKKKCTSLLKLMRNALAHGNIFTAGDDISQLVFLSKPHPGAQAFDVLAVSPEDFRVFLVNWFQFIAQIRMPKGVYEEVLAV